MFVEAFPATAPALAPEDPVRQEIREIIHGARVRLQDPDAWIRGAYAQDAKGNEDPAWRFAARWCAVGAIEQEVLERKSGNDFRDLAVQVFADEGLRAAEDLRAEDAIINWNDRAQTTHQDVLAAFARAEEQI